MPTFVRTRSIYTSTAKKHRDDVDLTALVAQAVNGKNYATDAAAAAGGVAVGELYHNAGAVRIRLT